MNDEKTTDKQVIVFHESLLNCIISELSHGSTLVFCVWFSRGSKVWSFICIIMFASYFWAKIKTVLEKNMHTFTSREKLLSWLDKK